VTPGAITHTVGGGLTEVLFAVRVTMTARFLTAVVLLARNGERVGTLKTQNPPPYTIPGDEVAREARFSVAKLVSVSCSFPLAKKTLSQAYKIFPVGDQIR